MCGIAGVIGKSKHPEASYELLTSLFKEIEVRGTDAAGFWGTEPRDGRILYHKEPVKSSEFIQKDIWKHIGDLNPNLMILHARAASQGAGHPFSNKNNHPFTSSDRTIGLVHNGRIPEMEYDALKKKYEVKSDCDSEILLRMFESIDEGDEEFNDIEEAEEQQIAHRLRALKSIWSQVIRGHMATAIGERLDDGHRRLWLFRNRYRNLWLADMRKYIGQIFFFSTPEIWQAAAQSCRGIRPFIRKKIKLIELPPEEVWVFRVSEQSPVVENRSVRKFNVCPQGFQTIEHTGPAQPIIKREPQVEIVTRLEDDDTVVYNRQAHDPKKKEPTVYVSRGHVLSSGNTTAMAGTKHSRHRKNQRIHEEDEARKRALELEREREKALEDCDAAFQCGPNYRSVIEVDSTDAGDADEYAILRAKDEEFENFHDPALKKPHPEDIAIVESLELEEEITVAVSEVNKFITESKRLLEDIDTITTNKQMEGSLTKSSLVDLMGNLEQISLDLQGTLKILEAT